MANSLAFEQRVANSFLLLLKNSMVMGKLVTTKYDEQWETSSKQVAPGDTVYVRRSPEYEVRDGAVASAQDTITGKVAVKIDKQKGVDTQFTSKEETLDVDALLENQMMKSKAAVLAQQIESDLIGVTKKFPLWAGTPGQAINSASDFFVGVQKAVEYSMPLDELNAILSPTDHFALASSLTGLNSDSIIKTALERAKLPMIGGVQPYMSQNVVNLTCGTRAASGAAVIDGNDQNVTYAAVKDTYTQSLKLKSLTAGHTIKAGEVFSIANVNAVNPRSKENLGYAQQFVVMEDAVATDGTVTVKIANPIIVSGAYKTCSAAPVDGAAVTWLGTASTAYRQNAIFHKSAIGLVGAKLVTPATGKYAFATDPDTGITIRYWRTSDGTNDTHLQRADVLYGTVMLDSRLGVRLSGTA